MLKKTRKNSAEGILSGVEIVRRLTLTRAGLRKKRVITQVIDPHDDVDRMEAYLGKTVKVDAGGSIKVLFQT